MSNNSDCIDPNTQINVVLYINMDYCSEKQKIIFRITCFYFLTPYNPKGGELCVLYLKDLFDHWTVMVITYIQRSF